MEMGSMDMGDGIPNLFYLQRIYWAFVGAVIGCAALVNGLNKMLHRQRYDGLFLLKRICSDRNHRLSAARRGHVTPAKPDSLFFSTFATITAISREVTHASFPISVSKYHWPSPTLGRFLLVSAELILVMVLCFYKLDPTDQWQWEDIGYRTGFIASAQLPLVILLASKNNIIGFLSGVSYEKLNWLHRWVSRVLFLNVTIHMSFWFVDWARYDYIKVKLKTDVITQRGFAAWCILLWIVLSSMAPVRRWNYEFFVVQHIVTFVGFLAAAYLHLPGEVKVYIWIPICLVVFDRFVRTVWTLYTNLSIFHPKSRRGGILTCKATFQPLGAHATRITINNPPIHWKAGQHVFLSCHGVAPFQSHPFTIATIPEDGRMEFLVKRKAGSTKRFFAHAEKYQNLPISMNDATSSGKSALIDGPYGRIRPLQQFDSVCLIAGGSGSTFTMPLTRDIVATWKETKSSRWGVPSGAATRHVRFIWVIRSREQYSWFASQLHTVVEDVQELRKDGHDVEIQVSVYVTCGASLGEERGDEPSVPRDGLKQEIALREISASRDEMGRKDTIAVASTSPKLSSLENLASKTCGPDGTCCYTKTIEDKGNAASHHKCHCNDTAPAILASEPDTATISLADSESSTKSSSPLASTDAEKPPRHSTIHPSITLLTGRPRPKTIIRAFLEQALGESAVVVCGPKGLERGGKEECGEFER